MEDMFRGLNTKLIKKPRWGWGCLQKERGWGGKKFVNINLIKHKNPLEFWDNTPVLRAFNLPVCGQ
jgi:hypothetical protein